MFIVNYSALVVRFFCHRLSQTNSCGMTGKSLPSGTMLNLHAGIITYETGLFSNETGLF
jgi:hypothetical protein